MRPIEWRSLGLTLALAAVAAGCGKDSNGPDPEGNNAAPAADFSSSCAGLTCTFTDLSVDDGQIAGYAWDFGGEGGSDQKNPTFTFPQEGEVSVTLTVTDDAGAEDAAVKSVSLTLPVVGGPAADFSVAGASDRRLGMGVRRRRGEQRPESGAPLCRDPADALHRAAHRDGR
jgi:hypothetical protein